MNSEYFEWCKKAWDNNWVKDANGNKDINKLKIWVQGGKITDVEFKEITGIDYVV